MPKQKKPTRKLKKPLKKKSINSKRPFLQKHLGLGLIIIGLILIFIPAFFYANESIQLSLFTPKVSAAKPSETLFPKPKQIIISDVNINLPIIETAITNNIWEIAGNGASHLRISSKPGELGSIILYGHNTNNRFGPILGLVPDEFITIITTDGKNHVYKITKTVELAPSQVDIFEQKEETLILYTCSGFADLKRFVVIAKPTQLLK